MKYNLFSCSERSGAFFGMALVFDGVYCHDIHKIYRLFDKVYNEIIINKRIFIEEISENLFGQGKFLVHEFGENEIEVNNIKNILLKNIEKYFVNDFSPLNSSFKSGDSFLILKLNNKLSKAKLLNALKEYRWVSISPDYPNEKYDEISEEGKMKYRMNAFDNSNSIFSFQSKIGLEDKRQLISEINELSESIVKDVGLIQKYIKKQPDLQENLEYYNSNLRLINDLKKIIETESSSKKEEKLKEIENIGISEKATILKKTSNDQENKKLKFFLEKLKINKNLVLGSFLIIVILLLVTLFQLFRPINFFYKEEEDCPKCIHYYENFDKYVSVNNFGEAWNQLEKLKLENKDILEQQSILLKKVRFKIENLTNNNNENDLREALNLLKISKKYGNYEVWKDSLDIIQTIRILQASKDFKSMNYNNAKEKCMIILNSECSEQIKIQTRKLIEQINSVKIDSEKRSVQIPKFNFKKKEIPKNENGDLVKELVLSIVYANSDWGKLRDNNQGNQNFKVGEKLLIFIKSDGEVLPLKNGEEWNIEYNIRGIVEINSRNSNPIKVDLIGAGEVKLTFKNQSCKLKIKH
ncbi:MAG: hypothetical protein IPH57_05095 [Saprospiraceae bacterium]|nr:hypothetical protein [Saprospiraceae bacterium]